MTTFSIREAAQLIGVSDDTLRRNIDRGVLRASRAGGHTRESAERLGLTPGTLATAVAKATTVIIETPEGLS